MSAIKSVRCDRVHFNLLEICLIKIYWVSFLEFFADGSLVVQLQFKADEAQEGETCEAKDEGGSNEE